MRPKRGMELLAGYWGGQEDTGRKPFKAEGACVCMKARRKEKASQVWSLTSTSTGGRICSEKRNGIGQVLPGRISQDPLGQ